MRSPCLAFCRRSKKIHAKAQRRKGRAEHSPLRYLCVFATLRAAVAFQGFILRGLSRLAHVCGAILRCNGDVFAGELYFILQFFQNFRVGSESFCRSIPSVECPSRCNIDLFAAVATPSFCNFDIGCLGPRISCAKETARTDECKILTRGTWHTCNCFPYR